MGICADQGLRSFKFRNGITISVPNSWVVVNEQDLRQYELARDTILKEKGAKPINPGIKASVPFQATRRVADTHSTGSVMFTLGPPEATQDEVAAWASPQIEKLGQLLGDTHRRALEAAGSTEVEVLPAAIRTVGGKTAVAFELRFVGPDGVRHIGEKFYVYMKEKTIILSF